MKFASASGSNVKSISSELLVARTAAPSQVNPNTPLASLTIETPDTLRSASPTLVTVTVAVPCSPIITVPNATDSGSTDILGIASSVPVPTTSIVISEPSCP